MGSTPTTPASPPADHPQQPAGVTEAIETQLTGSRAVQFMTKHVQPPAALYVTADDGLFVNFAVQAAPVSLALTATILLPDGRVQASTWNVTNSTVGTTAAFLFPLTEGFLINVSVQPQTGVRYGQTWIFVCVRRGGMASGVNLQTIISDTVDSYGGPTWPGGQIGHPVGQGGYLQSNYYGGIGAGSPFIWGAPAWARMQLRSLFITLLTSAAVATRQVYLDIRDTTNNVYYRDMVEATQTASTQINYSWGLMLGTSQTATANATVCRSFPNVPLLPNMNVLVGCSAMQAADQFQAVAVISEVWFSL